MVEVASIANPCQNKLKIGDISPFSPQFWQIIALLDLNPDIDFLGKKWGKSAFFGEEMGKFFECQSAIPKPGVKPSSLLI